MGRSSSRKKIFIATIGVLFILSLNFFKEEVRGFFYSISESIQKDLWKNGGASSNFLGAIFRAPDLKKENEGLKFKVQELLFQENYFKDLEKENKMLREALGLGLRNEFRLELAEIIGKDADRNSIIIDKGLESGISEGLFVITSQKVLVGKIEEVHQNYSRVLLIFDKESFFEAKISGGGASGLIKGLGGSRVLFDLIPKDKEIKEGDLIVSGKFLIGSVKKVEKIDVNPFQKAEISPLLDISNLDGIFIVLDF